MAIEDKTRKVLWARSGNSCAICKRQLVVDETPTDDAAVVGDECHIVSGKPVGPRFATSFPLSQIDKYDNLILLCRVHHKMVDDQPETYSADVLRHIKVNHEKWVVTKLGQGEGIVRQSFRLIRAKVPAYLARIGTAEELVGLMSTSFAMYSGNDQLNDEVELDLVAGFFQDLQDWTDLLGDSDVGVRVRAEYDLSQKLRDLEVAGFSVYAAREIQRLEGTVSGNEDWPVAIVRVTRNAIQAPAKSRKPSHERDA